MQSIQERLARITPTTIIVGIDVAKEEHWARITDYRGIDLMKPVKFHNSIDGFEKLLARVEKMRLKYGCDQVMIGMEPSGHYWRALCFPVGHHGGAARDVAGRGEEGVTRYGRRQTDGRADTGCRPDIVLDALLTGFQHCLSFLSRYPVSISVSMDSFLIHKLSFRCTVTV